MSRTRSATWLLVLAVGAALALRLVALDRKSLWLDEAATLRYAAQDLNDIVFARQELHPPLYYVLMHYWTKLGRSEFALRFPSALAGAAAIPLLYWLVREWGDRWSALTSAWLLAIAPLHVWYSQEARMYALVCTLGLSSMLAYAVAIRRGSAVAWVAWTVLTVTGLHTQYSMLLIVLVQIALFGPLWQATGAGHKPTWPALVAFLVAALLFVPQASSIANQLVLKGGRGASWYWYYSVLQSLLSERGIAASPSQLHAAVVGISVIALVTVGAAAWTLRRRLRRPKIGAGLTWAAMTVYLLILVASAVPRGLSLKRQTLILLPHTLGILAAVISTHGHRSRLLAGLLLVTLPLSGYVVLAQEQEPWRNVACFLEEHAEPQDAIAFNASYMQLPFDYYYQGEARRLGVGPESVPEKLSDLAMSSGRLWLVLSNDEYTDPQGTVQRWLDENRTLLEERTFMRVRLRLYDTG
jgi:mannosyltransferase